MLKNILLEMLRISSPAGQEFQMTQYITTFFADLGISTQVDTMGNCYIQIPGKGSPVLLTAHLDTVSNGTIPEPQEQEGVISSFNNGILGLDDKASVAVILQVVHQLHESKQTHRPLEIIFTTQEEPGCFGAKYLLALLENSSFDIQSTTGVCFDLPKPAGSILQGAAGLWRGEVAFTGVAAHSARPEEGRNAAAAMSVFVESFLQNKNQDVRVNVGYMHAGESESYNIIPAAAKCEVEIRSVNQISVEKERMQALFQKAAEQFGVQASVASEFVAFDAYTHAPEDAWIQQIQSAMEAANIEPITEPFSYGASDANLFQQQGINVAVLGNGVQNTHSVHEKVSMEALETTTTLLRSIVTTGN